MIHDIHKLVSGWASLSARLRQASSIRDVVRLLGERSSSTPAHLRSIARSFPEYRQVELAAEDRARRLIESGLEALGEKTLDELPGARSTFIRDFREPCRGHLPSLYQLAERGLIELDRRKQSRADDSFEGIADGDGNHMMPKPSNRL